MKKTKIIATIGPSSKDVETLREMILSGMDIARINMAYSTYDFAENIIDKIHKLNAELQSNVSIMLDLKGPDLSVCKFTGGTAYLTEGTKLEFMKKKLWEILRSFLLTIKNLLKK